MGKCPEIWGRPSFMQRRVSAARTTFASPPLRNRPDDRDAPPYASAFQASFRRGGPRRPEIQRLARHEVVEVGYEPEPHEAPRRRQAIRMERPLSSASRLDRRLVLRGLGAAALIAPADKCSAMIRAGRVQRKQRFDWRAEGASPGASGVVNREALDRAAAKAVDAGGYVSLGADGDLYQLESWRPRHADIIVDGNGATLQQAVPEGVASLAMGGAYGSLAALLVGSGGRGLRFENVRLVQDETRLAALPLANASRAFMGLVVVRRADEVRLIDVEMDAPVGPAFLWRGGDDGEVRGLVRNGRATVHNGFRNDSFAGDAGYADETRIFSPRRFRADLRFLGSPTDSQATVQFHLTGANDWDVAVRYEGVTRADVTLMRAYSNDYGLYTGDHQNKDFALRGRIRHFSARGRWKAPLVIEALSTEPRLDQTQYVTDITVNDWDVLGPDGTRWPLPPNAVSA